MHGTLAFPNLKCKIKDRNMYNLGEKTDFKRKGAWYTSGFAI